MKMSEVQYKAMREMLRRGYATVHQRTRPVLLRRGWCKQKGDATYRLELTYAGKLALKRHERSMAK